MEFTVTLDIENCDDCPFRYHIMEHGGPCGYVCNVTTRFYPFTDSRAIPEWCPLREANKEERVKGIKVS